MADLGGYEGVRQAPLPGLPRPAYSAKRWRTLPNSSPPHRSRRRRFVTSCPGGPLLSPAPPPAAAPPPARRRRRPPAASTSAPARPQQQPSQWPQHGAGHRKAARPASAPAKPVKCQGRRRPWDGRPGASGSCSSGDGDSTTPSPGGGPGGEFLFCSATGPRCQWYPKLHKSSFLFLRVPRGRGWQCARPRLHIPIPLSLRQWAAGSGPRTRCLLPRPLPSRGAR